MVLVLIQTLLSQNMYLFFFFTAMQVSGFYAIQTPVDPNGPESLSQSKVDL